MNKMTKKEKFKKMFKDRPKSRIQHCDLGSHFPRLGISGMIFFQIPVINSIAHRLRATAFYHGDFQMNFIS